MHAGHMMGMGFGLGFLNLIGTVLFWVALIWTIRFFVRGGFRDGGFRRRYGGRYAKWRGEMTRGGHGHGGHGRGDWGRSRPPEQDEADKLLRERLAKGEISEDEYAQLKAKLGENGGSSSAEDGPSRYGGRPEGGPLSWLRGDSALETARLRLAKGEITPDEFETIRRVLAD